MEQFWDNVDKAADVVTIVAIFGLYLAYRQLKNAVEHTDANSVATLYDRYGEVIYELQTSEYDKCWRCNKSYDEVKKKQNACTKDKVKSCIPYISAFVRVFILAIIYKNHGLMRGDDWRKISDAIKGHFAYISFQDFWNEWKGNEGYKKRGDEWIVEEIERIREVSGS